jgi:hypothetical protein
MLYTSLHRNAKNELEKERSDYRIC